ncbi:M56 family metallopeptidase [Thermophagus xiamenensis]|uniref:Outer membrane transport energization protein TonB n=1 Tax=Thermophagus xiamenensis TaxID=385682 RepID=A0A1I1V4B3_9BACT|nr:M56 family metallopeptidase [Thermophagus xiamenensis]SFD77877.1 outer membrane transport energization protein TonB [Thermophagus xiamenensis]
MELLLNYILKSSVWLTLFGTVYFLFLRNERYFFLNRLFLLGGMIASLLFPFITYRYTITVNPVQGTVTAELPVASYIEEVSIWTWQNILTGIIFAGAMILFFRAVIQIFKIILSMRHCPIEKYDNIKLIREHPFNTSFSFFTYVFVNPNMKEEETREIISHERAHIAQYHWIDLILIEWIRLFQWFNPMAWLYGQFIRQNHEYLADREAIHSTDNPAVYKATLLNQMVGGEVISLGNYFNYSLNKKRFIMMTNKSTSIISKLKPLVVLPCIVFVFYAFAEPKYQYISVLEPTTNEPGLISDMNGKTVKGMVVRENGEPLPGTSIVVAGTTAGTVSGKDGSFTLQNISKKSELVFSFVGYKTTKTPPEFGKNMKVVMQKDTIEIVPAVSISINKKEPKEKPLILVNGQEIPYEALEKIEPTEIKKIEVLKDKSAVMQYGDKGKNGVILIQTKLEKDGKKEKMVEARIQSTTVQPTFSIVQEMPRFPGGYKGLHDYILTNTHYPPKAKEAGIEGRVYVNFIISPNGKPTNIEVARSVHPLLDEEAKRVIASMPDWKPGKQRGKNVAVNYTLPVNFALNKTDSNSDQ